MSKLPQRERVVIPERKPLTLAREVAILRRHVFCGGCGKHMSQRSDYVYDHEIPLEICGRDEPEDMRPFCKDCDKPKTSADQTTIARLKRLAGETCAGPTRNPIPHAPMADGRRAAAGSSSPVRCSGKAPDMLTTSRGQPRVRPPAPFAMRRPDMLSPLRSPPKVVFVDTDGDAVARRRCGVMVLDRQAQCLIRDDVRVTLRNRRVFRMAAFILESLPGTDLSREEVAEAAGISKTDDFSLRVRQVRHLLRPFGIGIATAWGGRVIITDAEAATC